MRSVIENLIESIAHAVQSKIANILVAGGTAGTAQALKVVDPTVCTDAAGKIIRCPEKFINLAEVGFLGINALYIYLAVILLRIIADAIKSVGPTEALSAGSEASRKVEAGLRSRKSGVA